MSGSSGITMKEVRIRMSGTASNKNYGNLSPDVQLTFLADVENWGEALDQMIATTHDAFKAAALKLVGGFDGYRSADSMLAELGIRATAEIYVEEVTGMEADVLARVQHLNGVVPLGDDGEYEGWDDAEDTQEITVPPETYKNNLGF